MPSKGCHVVSKIALRPLQVHVAEHSKFICSYYRDIFGPDTGHPPLELSQLGCRCRMAQLQTFQMIIKCNWVLVRRLLGLRDRAPASEQTEPRHKD